MIEFIIFAWVNASWPTVIWCWLRNSKWWNNILKSELSNHLLENAFVTCKVKFTACYVCVFRLETKNFICIFFVTDTNINVLHKVWHNLLSLFACPKLLSEVKVTRNCYAVSLSSFTSSLCKFSGSVWNSRSNTCEVEPVSTFKDFVKIEIRNACCCDWWVGSVICNVWRSHWRTCFKEVDTKSVAALSDVLCFNTVFS